MGKSVRIAALNSVLLLILLVSESLCASSTKVTLQKPDFSSQSYTGSTSCRKCHEKFYQLWAPSHHGLAMQSFTVELARNKLTPQQSDITVGKYKYRFELDGYDGWIVERDTEHHSKYKVEHVMGGKNVYYFLTPMDGGRLQTLPLAYDVNTKSWFDMAASGVRHLPGQTDRPVDWKDWQYTFNTSCYGCHVSQVSTNYDTGTGAYNTIWKEPGINCEACHGPAEEHIRVCEEAPKGSVPKDLKIIRGGRDFSQDQNNATCSSCHAKSIVITDKFQPGDKFFDHFDLVTLENPDFYPDGRDLGENYTYTSWLMSPCVKSGKLDCLHCHTSSGRYKFGAGVDPNHACVPCHEEKVQNPTAHTKHKPQSPGNKCVSCHMPTTDFARMKRSDHSMRPPAPALTQALGSPNACNLCHKDKSPQWADGYVRQWRKRDYQAPELNRAGLIDSARKNDWARLDEMLAYVGSERRDEIATASLIRLIRTCGDQKALATFLTLAKDPSPLVRSSVASALQNFPSTQSAQALIESTGDNCRVVRIRAAAALAGFQNLSLTDADKKKVDAATKEYLDSLLSRPDQWDSYYNLGNYYLDGGDINNALSSYGKAIKLEPRAVLALVNQSMAYARLGEKQQAGESLEKALAVAPNNAAANFNMGLLQAERKDFQLAEQYLKRAIESDPQMSQAAFNLCVILAKDRPDEALKYCRKATQISPDQPRYVMALAFYLEQQRDIKGATNELEQLISRCPTCVDAYIMLGQIYLKNDMKRILE